MLGAKDRPAIFMLSGLVKYTKEEAERVMALVRGMYEEGGFGEVE